MSQERKAQLTRMSDDDLRSVYRYLMTVPPVKRDNGPPMVNVKSN